MADCAVFGDANLSFALNLAKQRKVHLFFHSHSTDRPPWGTRTFFCAMWQRAFHQIESCAVEAGVWPEIMQKVEASLFD